jgi:3-dehydroquinate synthase
MAGAFYQPRMVMIDPAVLSSLPDREFHNGMAEVIKYGAIRSRSLFETLQERLVAEPLTEIIGMCCRIKGEIVERDERDAGERTLLNFGHTFGHAIEKTWQYERYTHGEAVAFGMALAAEIGEEMGLSEAGTTAELCSLLTLHGLETRCPCPPGELLPLVETDKKSSTRGIQMVFLRKIGEAFVRQVSFAELEEITGKVEEKWKTSK